MTDTLVLLVAAWLVCYAAACTVWPYKRHGRCGGTGELRSPSGKAWRKCSCDDGVTVRAGRYVVEWLRFGPRRGE